MQSENKLLSDREQYEQARRDDARAVRWISVALVICVAVLTFGVTGCAGTVVPRLVESQQASFDGNEQNSGIITSTPSGFVVTDHFRERYNALIATYGADFKPGLKPDSGIAPIGGGQWLISKQAMVDFLTMNSWRKAGLKPNGTR